MSWKAEVIADRGGQWHSNRLRFKTRQEAMDYVTNLATRWASVTSLRVTETPDDPVNAGWQTGKLFSIEESDVRESIREAES